MIVAQLILFFVRKTHVLEHDGVVHDQTSGCPGSLFAGSPAISSKGYFSLDWQTQTLYLLEKGVKLGLDGVKNSWKLPSSLWYAIAEHDTGALVSIGNETAVFSTTTKKYENGAYLVLRRREFQYNDSGIFTTSSSFTTTNGGTAGGTVLSSLVDNTKYTKGRTYTGAVGIKASFAFTTFCTAITMPCNCKHGTFVACCLAVHKLIVFPFDACPMVSQVLIQARIGTSTWLFRRK